MSFKPTKPVIGILGGIGSGKSSVARMFAEHGCGLVDADDLSHRVLQQSEVVALVTERWGASVLAGPGMIDRKAVAKIIFNSQEDRQWLEALIHPRIAQMREAMWREFEKDSRIVAIVEDSPLLLEKGLDAMCDVLVFVEVDDATRLARVAQTRGWTAAEMSKREKSQLPLDIKAKRADYVVRNALTPTQCLSQVLEILSQILQRPRPA